MEDISANKIVERLSTKEKVALEINVGGKRMLVAKEDGNKQISALLKFTPEELYEFLIDMTVLAKAKGKIPEDPNIG